MSIQRQFNWTILNQYFFNLRKKWFRLIPQNKLLKIINFVKLNPNSIENFKNVLNQQSYENVRILAQNFDSNTLRSLMLRIIKSDISSNSVFDEKKTDNHADSKRKIAKQKFVKKSKSETKT